MSFNTTNVSVESGSTNSKTQDGSGTPITSTLVSAKQGLDVNIINSSTSVSGVVDNTSFIYGNGVEQPIGGVYQDTSPTLTSGNTGAVRLTQYRGMHVNLRDSSGNEVTTKPLNVQVVAADYGIVTNSVIHGLTTGGGGGYVDVKVNPSGALTVDATQATSPWVVSGTVAATQSGTWNINNISGTISLPTGAATEASLAKLTLTQGSTTSGQSGPLTQGAVTTAAPSYSTGQTSPLSLTTSGLLRVDGSGSTQPISGTVTANQGTSPWVVGQSTASNLNATVVGTGTFAVQAAQSGTWNINNISGTVSLPTGAATEASLAKLTLTQGSTTSGQSGTLVQGAVTTAAPSYSTAQTSPLSLTTSGALRVDGSASTQPISGTVTANQGGTWNIGTLTSITNAVTVAQATAASLNATVVGTGTFAVQADQSGNWSTRTQDGSGNSITSTSNALDVNLKTSSISLNVVQSTSATLGGMTMSKTDALVATATAVKASAGQVYYYHVSNQSDADAYLQFYNIASGSVTVGTSTRLVTLFVPQGGVLDSSLPFPITFSTAITIAATTTITGNTAPSTGLLVNIGYA